MNLHDLPRHQTAILWMNVERSGYSDRARIQLGLRTFEEATETDHVYIYACGCREPECSTPIRTGVRWTHVWAEEMSENQDGICPNCRDGVHWGGETL